MTDLPHFARTRPEPGKRAAWAMAVVVHLLLATFLIYGVQWQTSAPETVSVDLVRYMPATVADKPVVAPQEQKPPEPVVPNVQKVEPPAPPKADILRKEPEKPKTIPEKAKQSLSTIARMLENETKRMMDSRNADAADRELA